MLCAMCYVLCAVLCAMEGGMADAAILRYYMA